GSFDAKRNRSANARSIGIRAFDSIGLTNLSKRVKYCTPSGELTSCSGIEVILETASPCSVCQFTRHASLSNSRVFSDKAISKQLFSLSESQIVRRFP